MARLRFGPATHRKVKKWLAEGDFDVLHLHEPNAPSLSMLALNIAEGPIVATFHTSTTKSLTLTVFQGILRPMHEKIVGRIAVSDLARRWQMEALGTDAVEIPNGVDVDSFASAPRLDGYPRPGKTVLFLGRYDEPRKGMSVLLDALPRVVERFADVQLLIVGRGDEDELRGQAGRLVKHLRFLGQVDDAGKASAMRSADVYCAPNTGGESFGIVLVEAMAAGTPVVASDLDAFRRVLRDGEVGCLVPVGDGAALADALISVLEDDALRERYVAAGCQSGPPLRLVGGGQPDHAGIRDGRRVGRQGSGGQLMAWLIVAITLLVLVLARVGRLGVSDGQPAGPAARPLRPVLAGARRGAGAARGGGARGRDRRLRRCVGRQAAGGAGRRRGGRAPARA